MNAIHASDGSEMAARELAFFFPKFDVPWYPEPPIQRTLALIRPQALKEHRGSYNITYGIWFYNSYRLLFWKKELLHFHRLIRSL